MEYGKGEYESLNISYENQIFVDTKKHKRLWFWHCFLLVCYNSLPSYLWVAFHQLLSVINIVFIGHLNDKDEIAASGLAATTILIMYFYPVISNWGALDTLVSNSLGMGNFYMMTVFLNRSLLIQTLLVIPGIIGLMFTEQILVFLGQDPEISHMVQLYIIYSIPTLIVMWYFETIKRYLEAQGLFSKILVIQIILAIVHVSLWYTFIIHYEYRYLGAPLAQAGTFTIGLVMLILIAKKQTYQLWNKDSEYYKSSFNTAFIKDSFRNWGGYLRLSIPSVLMSIAESWAFELMAIYAGLIGIDQLSANVVLSSFSVTTYMFALGISIAACAMIGKELGEGNCHNAKLMFRSVLLLSLIIGIWLVFIILCFPDQILNLYTDNSDVTNSIYPALPALMLLTLFDSIQGAVKGVFRAMGQQHTAAVILIISFGVIGNIWSPLLAFHFNMSLSGIWYGHVIASSLWTLWFIFILYRVDWEEQAILAVSRSNH